MTEEDKLFFMKCKNFKNLEMEIGKHGFIGGGTGIHMWSRDFANLAHRNDFAIEIASFNDDSERFFFNHDGVEYFSILDARAVREYLPEFFEGHADFITLNGVKYQKVEESQ